MFLSEKLEDVFSSQIKFKEGNIIDFDVGFGCGVFVNTGNYIDGIKEENWKNWRSFFF